MVIFIRIRLLCVILSEFKVGKKRNYKGDLSLITISLSFAEESDQRLTVWMFSSLKIS